MFGSGAETRGLKMQHTPIITEEKLHAHADLAESRGLIPDLLLRLICASVQNPADLRIPVRGSVGQRGWDGILVSPVSFDPYVPSGQSFWEIGTGANPHDKATAEFNKRTTNTSEEEQSESTFVFVTPRSGSRAWDIDSQREWLKDRRSTKWKDIRILDGTKLVQWMYLFPEVDFWLADEFAIPTQGLTTPALHWKILSRYGSPPALKPEVFLIGRSNAVQHLTKLFLGQTRELLLQTRYPDEGIDFVAAALASLSLEEQSAFASRCLIIDNPATWKVMCSLQAAHVLIAHPSLDVGGGGADLRQHAKTYGHAVVFSGTPSTGAHGNSVRLHEPDPHELARELQASNYDMERARQIATRCGGRIPVLKRLLLDLSPSPDWAGDTAASQLALAVLIGRWNANVEADIEAVEDALGKQYGEWIGVLRPMTLRPDPPLIQRDEQWTFVSRFEGWQTLGPFIFDADLERFQRVALRVLEERDPKLELPADERWRFTPDAERRRYSDMLREGLAETLALLGSFPKSLASCTTGRPRTTARLTVRRLLEDADWKLWASLNDVMPLLAEAAPGEVLSAVENSLNTGADNPFVTVFAQERSGMSGRNYMTGLLWALETLAWDPEYVTRVVMLLGELAAIDPGGNWSNRPLNSIRDILLPWHPQTVADIPRRTAAVTALLSEQPAIGWKLLLELLPGAQGVTSGTRKPVWWEVIPQSWKESVTTREYREQVAAYADIVVDAAMSETARLIELLEHIPSLPLPARERLLAHLNSEQVAQLPEGERRPVWDGLMRLASVHRQHADAEWAMAAEVVNQIEQTADLLAPVSPSARYHRLFSGVDFELFEETSDYEAEQQKLELKRQQAVTEIVAAAGVEGLAAFAQSVDAPSKVGSSFGIIPDASADTAVLPSLLREEALDDFTSGFIWGRVGSLGWQWVEGLSISSWDDDAQLSFLLKLPFRKETWECAERILGQKVPDYWQRVQINPYHVADDDLISAAELLLANGRPRAALKCLQRMIYAKRTLPPGLAVRVLDASVSSPESPHSLDQHAARAVIKWLQENPATDDGELFRIEWRYLALLDRTLGLVTPKTLERRLAVDAAFFCEVIRRTFKSDKEEVHRNPSDEERLIAQNAFRLFHEWRIPPGTTVEGCWSDSAFTTWLAAVKASTRESGHYAVAMSQVGQVLPHVPEDPSGLWIHKVVASALNAKDADQLRSGFTIRLFNRRGTFGFTRGAEERKIAAGFRAQADDVENAGYPRFAAALRSLAESYEQDAERDAARSPWD